MHPFREELCGLQGLQLCQGAIQRPLPARPGVDIGCMARGLAFGSGSVEAMMLCADEDCCAVTALLGVCLAASFPDHPAWGIPQPSDYVGIDCVICELMYSGL